MRNHRNRKICPVCKGRGRISKVKMTSNGTICEFEVCYHCKGSGNHLLTSKEVKRQFRCTDKKVRVSCENKKTCEKKSVKQYRKYKKDRGKKLNRLYMCEEIGGRCILKKCSKYKRCSKLPKKNYLNWIKEHQNGQKEIVEKLMEGGCIGGDGNGRCTID